MKKYFFLSLALLTSACGIKLDKRASSADKAQNIGLHRIYQHTIRYNCDGSVKSDKYETTQSPRAAVRIHPKHHFFFHDSKFVNKNNNDTGCQAGRFFQNFVIDDAPGFCSMIVERGINEISYQFSYCKEDDAGKCKGEEKIKESGSLFVKINYSEEKIDTPVHIHPSPEECKPGHLPPAKPTLAQAKEFEAWLENNPLVLRTENPSQIPLPEYWRGFLMEEFLSIPGVVKHP